MSIIMKKNYLTVSKIKRVSLFSLAARLTILITVLTYCASFSRRRWRISSRMLFKQVCPVTKMVNQITTLKTLFGTKKGIENSGTFLVTTEIATRKWILRDLEENEEDESNGDCQKMRHHSDFEEIWLVKSIWTDTGKRVSTTKGKFISIY